MDPEPAQTAEVVRSGGRPGEQLARLLARAENGTRIARQLAEARFALMHYCGLQSCRHAKGPPRGLDRRTYRHSFLLPDGEVLVLWELEHNTGPDGRVRHAVFADRDDMALAEWAVDTAFGGAGGPAELPSDPWPLPGGTAGPAVPGEPDPADEPPVPGREAYRRAYTENRSPEHARRLLRRASNANAPGEDVLLQLHAAIAHDISIVTRRSSVIGGRLVSWALYEHAFLLLDGGELSLWEIDHTRTPDGHPVCEVYPSRDAALDTAVRRIEAGGAGG
ncbi:DUF6227 family protein [Actinacidiphila sp. ITFR-21]|uniref:DUF6227 family protein n=1 Tax=Actinacidiphila sp. ITFR-21 TaxID=3075199 RepID=UPI00288B27E4|nr:DUF6227 family protein [Streptomyces sp. ITFR-21]WNI19053.1 DUF6227 family protein [Streptomyces sp. ITFR-21]